MVAVANATADGSFSTTHLRACRRAAVQLGKHPVHADRESVRWSHSSNNPEDLLGQARGQVLSLQLMVSCLQSTKVGTKGERGCLPQIQSPWPRRYFPLQAAHL